MKRKRAARAEIYQSLTMKKEDEPEKILKEKSMSVKIPPSELVVGDGNTTISKGRTIRLAVPDSYGTSISSHCSVTLTCNQDDKTILKTARLCNRIRDKLLEEDRADMVKFVEEMAG